MKAKITNNNSKSKKEVEIPDNIFGVKMNKELLYQVVTSMQKSRQKPTAHAKTRKEVKGGGSKPWPQKGTGRARHGSIRSPLWKGGGVTFGPSKEQNFKKKTNKKMRKKALHIVLSQKLKDNEIKFIKDIKLKKPKTKLLKDKLQQFIPEEEKTLLLLPADSQDVVRACNNLSYFDTMPARNINPLDLLQYKYILIPQKGLEVIKETFNK